MKRCFLLCGKHTPKFLTYNNYTLRKRQDDERKSRMKRSFLYSGGPFLRVQNSCTLPIHLPIHLPRHRYFARLPNQFSPNQFHSKPAKHPVKSSFMLGFACTDDAGIQQTSRVGLTFSTKDSSRRNLKTKREATTCFPCLSPSLLVFSANPRFSVSSSEVRFLDPFVLEKFFARTLENDRSGLDDVRVVAQFESFVSVLFDE